MSSRDNRDSRDYRDNRDSRDNNRDYRDRRDSRDYKDRRDNRDYRDSKDNRDYRDNKYSNSKNDSYKNIKKDESKTSLENQSKEATKSKTFSITKSYVPDEQSQTYKKYILPQLNNLKKLEMQKKKNDEMREKIIMQQKILLKEQANAKEKAQKQKEPQQDLEKGVYVDREGRTRDADGNLILIQNDTLSTSINRNIVKKQQLKEMEKKSQNKLYNRVSKVGFHDNNIVGSSKQRVRRTLGGLQFEEDIEEYLDSEDQKANMLGDDLMDLLTAPKTFKSVKKVRKIKRTKLQTQDLIPDKQWWDTQFINKENESYLGLIPGTASTKEEIEAIHKSNIETITMDSIKAILNFNAITDSVSQFDLFTHVQEKGVVMPVFLTKDQKKKLKRMRKREKLQQKNDKIKLGLIEPDKPKLKLSNMALVMKEEYIIDPSRVEMDVRKQIQQRVDTHNQTNQSRKLTKEKRAQKSMRKLKRDSAKQTRIAVFRINEVKDRTHRFKIEMNAKQLAINGLFLFPGQKYKGPAVIVAEGGRKAIKFYKNLLMNRINWSEVDRANLFAKVEQGGIQEVAHQMMIIRNRCQLVWESVVTDKLFSKWRAVEINNDTEAIRTLSERKAQHFWDMILNFKQQS